MFVQKAGAFYSYDDDDDDDDDHIDLRHTGDSMVSKPENKREEAGG